MQTRNDSAVITVLFFGVIAERLQQRTIKIAARPGLTVADVVCEAGCAGFHPLLVAHNQCQISDMNRVVGAGDEVAIMPPFSGG
ncbi:MAG: MoaD/ThiS family protein [Mariprofundales bacterium]